MTSNTSIARRSALFLALLIGGAAPEQSPGWHNHHGPQHVVGLATR